MAQEKAESFQTRGTWVTTDKGAVMRGKFLGDERIAETVKRAFIRHENYRQARPEAELAAFMSNVAF